MEITVTWHSTADNSIFLYQVSTGQKTKLTSSRKADNPNISGNLIAYQDSKAGDNNIYLYDIQTGSGTQATSNKGDDSWPIISEQFLGYTHWDPGTRVHSIKLLDLDGTLDDTLANTIFQSTNQLRVTAIDSTRVIFQAIITPNTGTKTN